MGITYGDMKLSAWVDEDGTCPDTRHSVSGGVVMMGEGAISWFCRVGKKDISVASSESEYMAARIDEDNEGAMNMVKYQTSFQ